MTAPPAPALSTAQRRAVEHLTGDLRRVFGNRLRSVVAYGLDSDDGEGPLHTLALVEGIVFEDLAACVPLATAWRRLGLAVPLVLGRDEFYRTLDVFALEYGAIIASHVVVHGVDPFSDTDVAEADLRRACERQAKSHLIHLREGFLESGGQATAVARLIARSVPAFRALLVNIARLDDAQVRLEPDTSDDERVRPKPDATSELAGFAERRLGISGTLVDDVLGSAAAGTIVDPTALLSRYISAAERIWRYVDGWNARQP